MKKVICLIMAVLMIGSLFAGCGGGDDMSEQVTLKWIIAQEKQSDYETAAANFNKILEKHLPNTKLEIVYDGYDMGSKWSMHMSAGEVYDIAQTGYVVDMESEIKKGSYLALDELIEEYGSNIKKEMEEWSTQYKTGEYKGELYALPNQQPILHESHFLETRAEAYQYLDVDALLAETKANPKTTEKVYQIIEDYYQKAIAAGAIDASFPIFSATYLENSFENLALRGYDWVGNYKGGAYLCYDPYTSEDEIKIVNFFETEEYKLFIKYIRKWIDNGWIPSDAIVSTDDGASLCSFNGSEMWFNLDEEKGIRYVKDDNGTVTHYRVMLDNPDNTYVGANVIGSLKAYTAIPFTSEHPERAMMLLDLLRSEEGEELLNAICYGIEGTHYTLDGDCALGVDYTVQATGSSLYGVPHWVLGNAYLPYRTPNILEGQKEYAKDYVLNVKPSKGKTALYGFTADTSSVTTKVSQVKVVIAEYHKTLVSGMIETAKMDAYYNEFITKMQQAGLNEVLDEMNSQVEEFLK